MARHIGRKNAVWSNINNGGSFSVQAMGLALQGIATSNPNNYRVLKTLIFNSDVGS
jgi:hypothetical protein